MFVILHPHSQTNNTDKYRVVDGHSWMTFANGAQNKGYTILGEHDDYDAAESQRDELNRLVQK